MTEIEAMACVAGLVVFDRRDWSDAQVEGWARAFMGYADAVAGLHASRALAEELNPRDWSLHRWRQAYQRAAAARAQPALPSSTPEHVISLDDYIVILTGRAANGSQAAAREIELWKRYRTERVVCSVS